MGEKMRCLQHLVLATVMVAGSASVTGRLSGEESKGKPAPYSLKVGTKWTYSLGQDRELVMVAARQEKVGDQLCVVVEAQVDGKTGATEHMAFRKDGLYRFKFQSQVIDPPLCIYKPSAKKGDKWEATYKVKDTKVKTKFEVDIEDVTIGKKTYKATTKVTAHADDGKNLIVSACWYAKDVGMVRQTIQMNGVKSADLKLESRVRPDD
jgi:hypothetical protein